MNQMKLKRVILTLLVAGIILGSSNSFAAVASGSSATCSLGGKKCVDSAFVDSIYGYYYQLSMKCDSSSKYQTMAVLRGRPRYDQPAKWVMYPALKCPIGKSVSKRYDVYSYAKSHYDATYSNQVGARLYGNHCDSQKTGCYGTATATNTN